MFEEIEEGCNVVTHFAVNAAGSQWVDNIAPCFNQDHNLTITNILGTGNTTSLVEVQNITCLYSMTSVGSLCSCIMSCLLDLRLTNTTNGPVFLYLEGINCDEQQLEEFLNILTNSTAVNSLNSNFTTVSKAPSHSNDSTICLPPG